MERAHTILLWFFFFQAEDGIRYYKVTGVQTCALPISGTLQTASQLAVVAPELHALAALARAERGPLLPLAHPEGAAVGAVVVAASERPRSGERRGGEEGRSRGAPHH